MQTSRNKEKLKTEESKEDEKDSVKASTSGTPKKPPQTKATTLSADTSTAKHYSARNQKSDTVTHSEKIAKNKRALSRKKNSTDRLVPKNVLVNDLVCLCIIRVGIDFLGWVNPKTL